MASATQIDQQLAEFIQQQEVPIIDLRCSHDYQQGHISNSSHFELNSLIARMHELPQRSQALKLVGTQQQIHIGQQNLRQKGYHITQCLQWRREFFEQIKSLGQLEVGSQSRRLWRAAKAIEDFVLANPVKNSHNRALDLGCGGGRDAVYLAMNGWQVTAVDYLSGMLQKTSQFATRYHVSVECLQMDLENKSQPMLSLPNQFDLIVVMRYLYRPLFQQIKHQLSDNGVLIFQTFMEGCEMFGKPKNPRFILKRNELKEEFKEYQILKNETCYLSDGRPTNLFIARKQVV